MLLIPHREMNIAQHIRECETLDEATEYLYGVLVNMKIGIEKELHDTEELAKAWILYATKIQMLMPTMWDSDTAREMGWSVEYLKGYNDAIREVKTVLKKASEK
jgi:hypothetical protein